MTSRLASVSVITATLNAERFLPECIRAVREQVAEGLRVEHVIVDGGSDDGTVQIARASGCVILEGKDTGVFDALNKGIRASTGEVFTVMGADDVIAPGTLRVVVDWFGRRRSEWAVGAHEWINGTGRSMGLMRPPPNWIPREVFASLGWCCLSHQATYMTRDFFERLGGFDTSFKIMAEYKMFAEALDIQPYDRLRQRLVIGRLHGDNVSAATGSAVNKIEQQRIVETYGPHSELRRFLYRQALRIWLNSSSPGWFVGKRLFGPRMPARASHSR